MRNALFLLLLNHPKLICGNDRKCVQLRDEFDFWKVHGIMNTSGLLQSNGLVGVYNGKAEQPV